MNITLLIGWVVSLGLVIFGIFNGGELGYFIDVPSLAITVGGTIGVLVASNPISMLARLPKLLKIALFPPKFDTDEYIKNIVEYAKIARSKGLIALEESVNKCSDPFMKKALMLIVDANEPEKVRSMLEDAIDFTNDRHAQGRGFFANGVSMFPAFGMLGTLVGLVNMLKKMAEDPGGLGDAMATALITTFYGSLFANVFFAPIEASLKNANEDEILCMQLVCEGVLAIAAGSNPGLIKEKLEFMLPSSSKKTDDAKE